MVSLPRLRRPEHTGENRCYPCTATNLGIAFVGSAAVAALWPPAGVGLFTLCVAAVYLRGYLIPGTPALTARYLPASVLRVFEHDGTEPRPAADHPSVAPNTRPPDTRSPNTRPPDTRSPNTQPSNTQPDDPESVLLAANAIEPCPEEDDLCLTPAFRRAWHERIEHVRTEGDEATVLGTLLHVDDPIRIDEYPESVVAHTETSPVGSWESRAALLADLGAGLALAARYEGWDTLPPTTRSRAIAGLRGFLDRCPACGGAVTMGETRVRSCCRSHDVIAVACVGCGARLLEVDAPDVST